MRKSFGNAAYKATMITSVCLAVGGLRVAWLSTEVGCTSHYLAIYKKAYDEKKQQMAKDIPAEDVQERHRVYHMLDALEKIQAFETLYACRNGMTPQNINPPTPKDAVQPN